MAPPNKLTIRFASWIKSIYNVVKKPTGRFSIRAKEDNMMSAKRLDSETRKQQILEAAIAVFARKGFDGASMDDIVAESGLSKGGLYWHFDKKDDIIAAVLELFFDQEMAGLTAVAAENAPALERLQKLGQLLGVEMEQTLAAVPIALEFYAVAARQESVRRAIAGYFDVYRSQLEQLIADGVAAEEFRPVDSTATATTLIALFEGLALLWAVNPRSFELGAQSKQSLALLLRGLRQEPTPGTDAKERNR